MLAVSGGFNWRPHVEWPTGRQHNGPLEAPLQPVSLQQIYCFDFF